MFSTTPRMGTPVFSNIRTAFFTSISARSCGVVTTTAPATGVIWTREIWTSPVPGGRSMTR
jgi:hypothetical protein